MYELNFDIKFCGHIDDMMIYAKKLYYNFFIYRLGIFKTKIILDI